MTDPTLPLSEQDAVHADLVEILNALSLGDHARPYSSHDVVQREVLPAIRALAETATNLGRQLGRAEALALRCGCAVWPEHTLSHHARKEDSTRPASEPEQRPDDDPPPTPTCDGRNCGGRAHE